MTFTFTQAEIEYILNVLAQRPYAEVAKIVHLIQDQAKEQNAPTNSAG